MPSGDGVWLRRSVLLLLCTWPVALHYSIFFGAPEWPARVNAAAAGIGVILASIAAGSGSARILAAAIFLLLVCALVVSPQLLLYAPPVLINGTLAAVFAASLRSGREPLISVFASLEHDTLPPELAQHARSITWCWTLLLAAIAIIALVLAIWATLETWSLFVNVVGYLLIGILFAGEYVYRRIRYRHYRHASLLAMIRNVRRVNLFSRR